ncbi:MAG: radical SAM protein [Alistipes sp.]|nr:radical SAM protein [Candidatus Minthomonas equi]
MTPLIGKTLSELKEICREYGFPAFTASQMADWLYKKRVRTLNEMTNLSKSAREKLSAEYEVGRVPYADSICSRDGTRKYLFPVELGNGMLQPRGLGLAGREQTAGDDIVADARKEKVQGIEAVMIPDEDRRTLCVSSQAGCKMGCRFCMTGRQGFHGHLTTAGIINQFLEVEETGELTNTVFMGMGEPLDNWENVSKAIEILTSSWGFAWSPKRITLSTIGVLPNLKKYLDGCSCHIAVSLHNPFHGQRLELMPAERAYPIKDTVELLSQYDFSGQRRVSFEYIMFSGVNDSVHHADALIRMLRPFECRVNLIRFHKIPDSPLNTSPMQAIERFQNGMNAAGILTTLRASRGEDILAACGMLSGKKKA